MGLRPFRSSVENFSTLAGLEVTLGQTWSPNGSDMVLMSRHSVDIGLRPCLLSLENFSTLAGLEVKLGQIWSLHGQKMALMWS